MSARRRVGPAAGGPDDGRSHRPDRLGRASHGFVDACRAVVSASSSVDLALWPQGTRMLVRREEPHPGAQLTFSDLDGRRHQLFITDHPEDDVSFLEALYRGRGRSRITATR